MIKCKFNSLVITLLLLVPCLAYALPGGHDPAVNPSYTCNSCHINPATYGNTDANYASNVCLRCHSGTGDSGRTKKTFAPEDFSNPFNTVNKSVLPTGGTLQSSHKWFGSDTVPAAGAVAPIDNAISNGLNKNASFTGTLFCARCHNVHGTSGLESNNAPYLRYPNDQDQLCLNCHRPRDTKDHTVGTHPVNVSYTSARMKSRITAGEFRATPIANPANPTGQVNLVNSKVVCSTCHRMHNTDSRASTFDPYSTTQAFGQLSSSKGYLLRVDPYGKTASAVNICTNCHAGKANHNLSLRGGKAAPQCNDCHSGHVEYDAAAAGIPAELVPNVNLVRRYLQYSTAGRVNKRILYRSTTTKEYYNATKNGVCQSCHNPPSDHYVGNTLSGAFPEAGHLDCASCHAHNEVTGSFSVGGGGCTSCHGQPPTTAAAGGPTGKASGYSAFDESLTPHASHAGGTQYGYSCSECHSGNTHNSGATYTDVFKSTAGIKAGAAATYASPTCTNVYCHSSGRGTYKGGVNTVAWGNNKGSMIGQPSECTTCHDSTTYSTSHTKHITTLGYGCVTCHASTVSSNTAVLPAAKQSGGAHVNGLKDVQFSGVVPATGSSCTTVACHSNGKAAAPVITPDWASAASGACNACHLTAESTPKLSTGAHITHNAVIGSTVNTVVCNKCHTYTGETIAPHVNGTINVNYDATGCATSACHGAMTAPTWTATYTGMDTCTKCHGTLSATGTITALNGKRYLVAPSDASATANTGHVSANVKTGAHETHLRFLNGFSNYSTVDYRCTACHGTGLLSFTGSHSNGASTPQGNFRDIATKWGTMSPTYSGVTCSNTYCHNPAASGILANAGSNVSPSWNDPTYFDNGGKNQINCGKCHKVPGDAGFTKQAAHGAGMVTDTLTDCTGCHGHNGDTAGVLGQRHLDGKYYANGACDTCHGYPPMTAADLAARVGGTYVNAKVDVANGGGHHKLHLLPTVVATQGFTPCLPCHPDSGLGWHNQGNNTVIAANVNIFYAADAGYILNGTRGKRYDVATKTCSNVSCHYVKTSAW